MIYFLVFCICIYCASFSLVHGDLKGNSYFKLAMVVLGLFAGLRVDAGYDYGSYVQLIEGGYYSGLFEPVPKLFADLATITNVTQLFFVINSFTLSISIYFLTRNETGKALFVPLFFALPFCYIDSFSLVRQYTAMSFIVLAFVAYPSNKIYALLLLLAAFASHHTAYFACIIIFVCVLFNSTFMKFWRIAIVLVALGIYFVAPLAISESLLFAGIAGAEFFGGKGFLLWILITIPALYRLQQYFERYTDPIFLLSLVGISLYASLIPHGYFFARFFIYFSPFVLIFITRVVKLHNSRSLEVGVVFFSAACLLGFLYSASQNLEFDFLNNYKIAPSHCENCNIRGINTDSL